MKMTLWWIGVQLTDNTFRYIQGPYGYDAAAKEALQSCQVSNAEIRTSEIEVI